MGPLKDGIPSVWQSTWVYWLRRKERRLFMYIKTEVALFGKQFNWIRLQFRKLSDLASVLVAEHPIQSYDLQGPHWFGLICLTWGNWVVMPVLKFFFISNYVFLALWLETLGPWLHPCWIVPHTQSLFLEQTCAEPKCTSLLANLCNFLLSFWFSNGAVLPLSNCIGHLNLRFSLENSAVIWFSGAFWKLSSVFHHLGIWISISDIGDTVKYPFL